MLLLMPAFAWVPIGLRSPMAGLGLFMLAVLPLARWLVVNHFGPLSYAVRRGNHNAPPVLAFPFNQMLALSGLLVILAIAGMYRRTLTRDALSEGPIDARFVRYLAVMAFGPIAVAITMAAVAGTGMKSMWGTPMLSLFGLFAICLLATRLNETALRRIRMSAITLLLVLPAIYAIATGFAPLAIRAEASSISSQQAPYPHKRANWPQKEIATTLKEIWTEATGRPLTLIVGDNWTAGLIATAMNPMPLVYTKADPIMAPWIKEDQLIREGALFVWPCHLGPLPQLDSLIGNHARHTVAIALPRFPKAPPACIGYAILLPVPASPS
jgi:hypothetical protein